MPINIDSYTTTAGTITPTQPIVKAIKEAIVTDDLDQQPESLLNAKPYGAYYPLFITGTYPKEADIPAFAHPISVLNVRGRNFICTDLRMFLKKEVTGDFNKRISNRIDFDYAVSRTILNLLWAGGRQTEFRSGFSFSAKVFGEWVAQTLMGGLGLEPQETIPVQVVALAYYSCLCENTPAEGLSDKQKLTDWIYNLTGFQESGIEKVIGLLEPMVTLEQLLDNIKKVVNNIRLTRLNAGTFTSLIRSNWYGVNAPLVLGVCTEHPPTWTAIVHHTLASKSYQRCLIGQVVMKANKKGSADSFMRHYSETFQQQMRFENFRNYNPVLDDHSNYDGNELALEAANRLPIL